MDISKLRTQKASRVQAWVKIPGTEVEVLITKLLPLDLDRLSNKREVNKKGRLVYKLYREAVLNECVKDWKGITDGDQPLPVTDENRRLLDETWQEFRVLWVRESGFISKMEEEDEEAEELPNS
jgi:hypothetical protein